MRGFSLFELLFVIALVAMIATFSLPVELQSFSNIRAKSDAEAALVLLRHAQLQSLHTVCANTECTETASHGVHMGKSFSLFKGVVSTTTPTDAFLRLTTFSSSDTASISFDHLGVPSTPATLTFGQPPQEWVVTVSATGTTNMRAHTP